MGSLPGRHSDLLGRVPIGIRPAFSLVETIGPTLDPRFVIGPDCCARWGGRDS